MPVRNTVLLILALAPAAAGASPGLDEPCPVEWRNVPFRRAIEDLCSQFNLPLLIDSSVTPEKAQRPVRLYARHLTGRQALKWLARWAGVEAVLVDGCLLVADTDCLPRIWREQVALTGASQPAPDQEWLALRTRSADLDWIDAPLSLVARDVPARFGVDVVFHAALLEAEPLVNLQQAGMTLSQLCDALAGQLQAGIDWVDGAMWVRPRPAGPGSRPASGATQPGRAVSRAASRPAPAVSPDAILSRVVEIDPPAPDWEGLARLLAPGGQFDVRLEVPPGAPPPDWRARGTVREVLEGAKLLGRLDYRIEPAAAGNTPVLLIQVRGAGR